MNLHESILSWSAKAPPWQSDLVRRLYGRWDLEQDGNELGDVLAVLLAAHGIPHQTTSTPPVPQALRLEDIPRRGLTTPTRIHSLSNFKNIAAVAEGQVLTFEPTGVTVVYGENGAGKSSYARVLKQACRAADKKSHISPNLLRTNAAERGEGTATISHGDPPQALVRKANTPPAQELRDITVFDSSCARFYVSDRNQIEYVPPELLVFKQLALVQQTLERLVQDLKRAIPGTPAIDSMPRDGRVYPLVSGLTAKSDETTLRTAGEMTQAERDECGRLQLLLSRARQEDPTVAAKRSAARASSARQLHADLQALAERLGDEPVSALQARTQEFLEARTAAEALAASIATDTALAGIGTTAWRTLWAAAKQFVADSTPSASFPPTASDESCPLCRQPISLSAHDRMHRLHEFVTSQAQAHSVQCQKNLNDVLNGLRTLPCAPRTDVSLLALDDATRQSVESYLASALARRDALFASSDTTDWNQIPGLAPSASSALLEWISACEIDAQRLLELADPVGLEARTQESLTLEARTWLSERLEGFVGYLAGLKLAAKHEKAIEALQTTKITALQTRLTEEFVTSALRAELTAQLETLGIDHLPIVLEAKGEKGATVARIKLESALKTAPDEVLSEGEYRALALAFFLAEVRASSDESTLVLDDPVSSLDHHRREHVARVLAQEAARRQVIVFTHDLAFALMLEQECDQCAVRHVTRVVRRGGSESGIVDESITWIGATVSKRLGRLADRHAQVTKLEKTGEAEEYRLAVKMWCVLYYETLERLIEERVLAGVLQRFSPEIRPKKLSKINLVSSTCARIDEAMTWSSNWRHDEAATLQRSVPTPAFIAKQLQELREIEKLCPAP